MMFSAYVFIIDGRCLQHSILGYSYEYLASGVDLWCMICMIQLVFAFLRHTFIPRWQLTQNGPVPVTMSGCGKQIATGSIAGLYLYALSHDK